MFYLPLAYRDIAIPVNRILLDQVYNGLRLSHPRRHGREQDAPERLTGQLQRAWRTSPRSFVSELGCHADGVQRFRHRIDLTVSELSS